MPLKDPPRLLDSPTGAPDFVREALDAGRADVPRTDQLARLAQRLPIDVPPPQGPGTAPAPVTAIPSALPGAIVGAVLGLAVIGIHALFTRADSPPAPALIATSTTPPLPERSHHDDAITTRSTALVRAVAAPAISAVPSMRSADKVATAPSSTPAESERSGQDLPENPSGSDLGITAPTVDTETEIQLLQRAQDALAGSPARALELVNRHAARFSGSGLGQEREVIAVDALVRLGRVGEARARAAAFAARFPTSAHLRRLQALVPNPENDGEVHKDPGVPAPTGQ